MDVLGRPIVEAGPIKPEERRSIHRAAPKFAELSPSVELLETGIKVIDLICPFAKGGKIGLFGGAGVGKTVNMLERSEEHTSELQSRLHLVCRLLLEKKKKTQPGQAHIRQTHERDGREHRM